MRRPQARSRRGRRRSRAALDHDLTPGPISRNFTFPLSCSFPLTLVSKLRRRFPIELFPGKPRLVNRRSRMIGAATPPSRRQQGEQRMIQIAKQRGVSSHPIHCTPTNTRFPAVKPADDFVPPNEDKQPHPLVRRIQDRRIVPGQPAKLRSRNAKLLRGRNHGAEVLAQSPRRSLVANVRKRGRPPRKHRHQRLARLGQLGLQSGPRPPRRLKIRLLAGIDNGFRFPRRSHLSHTKLAFAQPRLKPRSPLHLAPQMRPESQRLRALKHGAKLRNPMLRALPGAHSIGPMPDNATPLTAIPTNNLITKQPQRPHPLAARRAPEPRPRAAARELPQVDADGLLDVSKLDKERRRLVRDGVRSPQAASPHGWQIIAVFRYHRHV